MRAGAELTATFEHLQTALEAKDEARALEASVTLWQRYREPRLARLASRLGQRLAPHVPRGSLAEWLKLAKGAPLERRSALLAQLGERSWRDTLAQLELIATWEPDPRSASALLHLFETQRFRGGPTRPLWEALLGGLVELADDRVAQALEVKPNIYAQAFPTWDIRGWVWRELSGYAKRARAAVSELPELPAGVELDALLSSLGSDGGGSLEALEQAIYDDPHSDEARLVYADALLERGDPRGELITLQLLPGKLSKAQRERIKALLKQHGAQWHGPLSRVFYKGSLVYRRGFLVEGDIDCGNAADVRAVRGLPQWRTLESLRTVAGSRHIEEVVALLSAPELRGLRRLGRIGDEVAPRLLARDQSWALEAMQIWGHYSDTGREKFSEAFAEAFSTSAAAANLVELGLRYSTSPTPWKDDWSKVLVAAAPRLNHFEIASDSQSQVTHEQWLLGSVERELAVPSQRYTCDGGYRHRSGWEYQLERGAEGELQLVCSYKHRAGKGDYFGRLAELLGKLPAAKVRALTVKAPRYSITAEEWKSLRSAIEPLALDKAAKLPKS